MHLPVLRPGFKIRGIEVWGYGLDQDPYQEKHFWEIGKFLDFLTVYLVRLCARNEDLKTKKFGPPYFLKNLKIPNFCYETVKSRIQRAKRKPNML
jgi:hypothetical protein